MPLELHFLEQGYVAACLLFLLCMFAFLSWLETSSMAEGPERIDASSRKIELPAFVDAERSPQAPLLR